MADEGTTPPQQTQRGQRASANLDEVVVEIANDLNRNVQFPPTKETLRGRWSSDVLKGVSARQHLVQMPNLPGLHIQIDPRRRAARIYDPLGEPHNAELLRRINVYYPKMSENGQPGRPEDTKTYPALTDTALKTWLYWVARLVESNDARVVKGTLPTFAQIDALPGKTEFAFYHESSRKVRYREDAAALEAAGV